MWQNREGGRHVGQTSVDFLIGFSIFAMTLLFVLQMATGSVINTAPESQTKDALSERTAEILLQNWTETQDESVIDDDAAEDYLDRDYEVIADDLNIPMENGEYLYRYNITVTELDGISDEPPVSIGSLEAGNTTPTRTTGEVAGETRVGYLNDSQEMAAVRVKVW